MYKGQPLQLLETTVPIFTLNHNTETTTLNIFKLKGWGVNCN